MARKLKSDRILFTATLLLVCASVVMVYSASVVVAAERFGQPNLFLTKQALWIVLGLAGLALAMRIDYRIYKNDRFVWAVLGLVGVMLVAVLFSDPINGARRWFNVGGLGIQPSELAKLAVVLFAALILERRMHRIDEVRYSLLPLGIVVGLLCGLILLEPDAGTAGALAALVAVMVFAAGLNYRYVAAALLAAVPAIYLVVISAPYRLARWNAFIDPYADPRGDGFQAVQSFIAVGTGGVFGRGLMQGVQKMFFLPEPHTDFIFAVIGEELGLLGTTAVLVCFCVIGWRGLRIAIRAEDAFGSFIAIGLTTMICLQALANMSVVIGLLPTKGIPLPLVSAGGSSLLVCLVSVGVLLNVSQHEMSESRAVVGG
jgi:cell division protein FtsW